MELTDKNYNDIVLKEEKAIFIDFYSPMCSPCTELKTFIEDKLEDYGKENGVLVVKCNVSKNPKINEKFKISSVPFTVIVTKDKKFKEPEVGLRDASYYFGIIDKYGKNAKKSFFKKLFS